MRFELNDVRQMRFETARLVHRTATGVVALLSIVHMVLTAQIYSGWSPDALWFLLAGLGLALLALMNWAPVGLEPCSLPTAPAVKWANLVYAAVGGAALIAVPQPHAFVLVVALTAQALASQYTLQPSRNHLREDV